VRRRLEAANEQRQLVFSRRHDQNDKRDQMLHRLSLASVPREWINALRAYKATLANLKGAHPAQASQKDVLKRCAFDGV
jgi:hypothetical protein